jgi:hypothetical protein
MWLFALLVVIWLVLMGLLAALTLFFQGYVYTEPVQGITWRAPAAGSLVALSLLVWVFCDYSSQGRYGDWLKFNPRLDQQPFPELIIVTQLGKTETYKRAPNGSYVRSDGGKLPTRPLRVTVKENGEEVVFEPDKDARTGKIKPAGDEHVYYHDKKNRTMRDDQLGILSTYSYGNLAGYLLLNLFHFAAWLAALWLLLDFRLGHAIGLAIVLYVAVLLLLLPPVLSYTERVAAERSAAAGRTGG